MLQPAVRRPKPPPPDARLMAADVEPVEFPGGWDELVAALADQERRTALVPIDSPRQILLDVAGRTQVGGRRLSAWALRGICRRVSPGLGTFVTDLSGLRSPPDARRDSLYSLDEAVAIYNVAVARRFEQRLLGYTALVDSSTGMIDAVVGPTYSRLPNGEFVELAKASLKRAGRTAEFHSAVLVGRRLTVRFVVGPRKGDPKAERFLPGWVFVNSESGDASLRGAPAVIWDPYGYCAVAVPEEGAAARHSGPAFVAALEAALDKVSAAEPPDPADRLEALESINLGFPDDEDEAKAWWKKLTSVLTGFGLTRAVARRVLLATMDAGGRPWEGDSGLRHLARRQWPDRTADSLYLALQAVAAGLFLQAREKCERLAFRLLAGDWQVPVNRGRS